MLWKLRRTCLTPCTQVAKLCMLTAAEKGIDTDRPGHASDVTMHRAATLIQSQFRGARARQGLPPRSDGRGDAVYLGAHLVALDDHSGGKDNVIVVDHSTPGSPADQAGLAWPDRILKVQWAC